MRRVIIVLYAILLLAVAMSGCNQDDPALQEEPEVKITRYQVSWPYYDSLEALSNAAGNVYEGKVTNISFKVINTKSGEPAAASDDPKDCSLYTIYEVSVTYSHRGANGNKAYIRVPGGLEGLKVSEQCKAMEDAGIFKEDTGIQVMEGFDPLDIGGTYLFLTNKDADATYHRIINTDQFAFRANQADSTGALFTYQSIKSYISTQH